LLQNLRRKLRRDWLGRDQSELRSEGLWDELNKVPRYVFANEAGRIDDHANIAERYFRPALRAAGLERRRPHELRHTFASLLLHRAPPSRGVLMYIRRQMGHASLETTINTYAHLIDDLGTRLVDLLPGADDTVPVPDDASTAGEGGHE
jgi:integrase